MDQAVGMDHLHSRREGHGLFIGSAAHPAEIQGENGPQPLPSGQKAVVRGLKDQFLRFFQKGGVNFFQVCLDLLPV